MCLTPTVAASSRLSDMLCALTKIKNLAFNRQCVRFIPQLRFYGKEPPACLFDAVLKYKTDLLKQLNLSEDHHTTSILKGLQTAKVFNISACGKQTNEESLVQGVTVSDVQFDVFSVQPSTIYFRHFYPTLLSCLLEQKYSILMGNPGISKSWFQWYILYHMVNENVVRTVEAPKLIVRQVAQSQLVFILPELSKAFNTPSIQLGRLVLHHYFQHDAVLYLVEPEDSLSEPEMIGIQTILTCSPDRRRYHEFQKKGAAKHIMPVWKLDELQLVAAHIRENTSDEFLKSALTSEGIKDRYSRFGGIFRYVIPSHKKALEDAENEQQSILGLAKTVDTFVRGTDIEKRDDQKENISHFLLHYKVNEEDFRGFEMMIASEYVQKNLDEQHPSDTELHGCIHELMRMFRGGKRESPFLFEYVVYHMLVNGSFKWSICEDGQNWKDRCFNFRSGEVIAKHKEEVLKNMLTGVLYRPVDPKFPAVDMLWVEENEPSQRVYFGIQVTFAKSHAKSKTVYEKLYDRIGLNQKDKLKIYFMANPYHSEHYTKLKQKHFFMPQLKPDDNFLYDIKFATINAKEFDRLRHRYYP